MERRQHPSYDRETVRFLIAMAAWLVVTAGIALLGSWLQAEELHAVAGGVFLAGVGYALAHGRRINACPCPACGRPLSREPDSTEFVCPGCRVVWWTRSFGSSLWDWGRRTTRGT
jgi:hypothetical protein